MSELKINPEDITLARTNLESISIFASESMKSLDEINGMNLEEIAAFNLPEQRNKVNQISEDNLELQNKLNALEASVNEQIAAMAAQKEAELATLSMSGEGVPIADPNGGVYANGIPTYSGDGSGVIAVPPVAVAAPVAPTPSEASAAIQPMPVNPNPVDPGSLPAVDPNGGAASVYAVLASMGYSKAAICAILANMQAESGFRTTAVGDGGTSYGLCQWHAGRKQRLFDFCAQNGYDVNSVQGQCAYLDYELKTGYGGVYSALVSAPDTIEGAKEAAKVWCIYFEVPANRYQRAEERAAYVDRYWNAF